MFALSVRRSLLVAVIFLTAAATQAPGSDDLTGTWLTDEGLGAVQFSACGAKRCGRIVWLKEQRGDDGKPLRDVNNPNAKERDRLLCGLEVIRHLERQEDGSWDNGTVYDPDEGKTYSVAIKALRDGNLEVTGYLGLKSFSETMIWKRLPDNGERCSPL